MEDGSVKEIMEGISAPSFSDILQTVKTSTPDLTSLDASSPSEDLFAERKRSAWNNKGETRCDFQYRLKLEHHSGVTYCTIWRRSLTGRLLTEIKSDRNEVAHFSDMLSPVILEMLGYNLSAGDWCVCSTPRRRHKDWNFACAVAEAIAAKLSIPYYEDVAEAKNAKRVGAVFSMKNCPKEVNIICVDDFVTTGSTFLSMKHLLQNAGKNVVFFAGINNRT